ncbi:MAG: T9SS type A sorting domain-containing protein [Bacteroidales bacterium]|nr:T9SS type A sorting domain-containing protein [Bacteroidales bacterium]NLO51132.1 T9SS type A sorting domain-containing protein [Bacteroidales bacterium]
MKTFLQNIIILLATLMFPGHVSGQVFFFGDPEPFILDDHDKQNAVLGYAGESIGYLLIYEQPTDSASTAIVYWRYLSNDPPVTLIAVPGVHFRNPKLFHPYWYFPHDTVGYVFYEKVVGESTGLYYITVTPDGGQSLPVAFAVEGSVNNLYSYSYQVNSRMVYHSNGNVLAFYPTYSGGEVSFSIPDTVFTGEITDLAIQNDQIFWLTPNNDSTLLMMSQLMYPNYWSDPQAVKTEKQIASLGGFNFDYNEGWLSFTFEAAGKWYINNVYNHSYGPPYFYLLDIESDSAFDYDAFATYLAVKGYDPDVYFSAFIRDTMGAREVFMRNKDWDGDHYFQLSNLGTECRNPKFFLGEADGDGFRWGYLIWEAFVDGHWQIYQSRASFGWDGINEQQQPEGVSVSPNPARDFVRIQNSRELDLNIKIMDMSGRLILQTAAKDPEFTITTSQWPRGVYILSATSGRKTLTQKIVVE